MTTATDTGTTQIEIDWRARECIAQMERHVSMLLANYGPNHEWYRCAAETYGQCIGRIMAFPMGPVTRVFADGAPLSLYIITGDVHMGLIFRAVRRHCTREGCKAYANDDGHVWTYNRDDPRCEDHEWNYPLEAPTPGTWSTHT